jgi:serine/threonine-protein kinase RsbW
VIPTYRATFSGDYRNVPLARNAVASFARICGFSDDEVADIRVATGEALSNAVEHGRSDRAQNGFSVRCTFSDEELTIEVRDNGEGFASDELEQAHLFDESTRGFGIFLMKRLMDRVNFDRHGTVVRLTRRHHLVN